MPQVREPTEERLLQAVLQAQAANDIAAENNRVAQKNLRTAPSLENRTVADRTYAALEAAEAVLKEAARLYGEHLAHSAHPAAPVRRTAEDDVISVTPTGVAQVSDPAVSASRRPQELPFGSGPIPVPTPTPSASWRRRNHTVVTNWRRYAPFINWAALGAVALALILLVGAFWAYNNTGIGRDLNATIGNITGQWPSGSGGPTNSAIVDYDTCTVKLNDGSTQSIEGCTPRKPLASAVPIESYPPVVSQPVHFKPEWADGDNCYPEMDSCTGDIAPKGESWNNAGQPAVQVAIVWGVYVEWNGNASGNPNGNGCALMVVPPNEYLKDVTIIDGRWEYYDVDPTRVFRTSDEDAGWLAVLAKQRADEQTAHFGCPDKTYEDIPVWTSGMPSPPCNVQGFSNCEGRADLSGATQTIVTDPVTTALDPGTEPVVSDPVSADPTSKPCRFDTADCKKRNATIDNQGNQAHFQQGDAVMGAYIELDNGKNDENCFVVNAPDSGTVHGGVVHYWKGSGGNEENNVAGRCNF